MIEYYQQEILVESIKINQRIITLFIVVPAIIFISNRRVLVVIDIVNCNNIKMEI